MDDRPATGPAGDWLLRFERENGRPLRVLHIGNIANNAYNNAKIQRQLGIHADVLCYEYYHVMGCPEWEDADFEGDVGDPFYPDWWSVDLHGFCRPRWFVQGRLRTCQRYLLAHVRGDRARADRLWRVLSIERWLRTRRSPVAIVASALLGLSRPEHAAPTNRWSVASHGVLRSVNKVVWRLQVAVVGRLRFGWSAMRSVAATAVRKSLAAVQAAKLLHRPGGWRDAALLVFPRRLARLARTDAQLERVQAARAQAVAQLYASDRRQRRVERILHELLPDDRLRESAFAELGAAARRRSRDAISDVATRLVAAAVADPEARAQAVDTLTAAVIEDQPALVFRELFPDRTPLTREDYAGYLPLLDAWRPLLEEYDIVQGYATDPIIPILADFPNFAAYEHGTLREIPFEESAQGRICALAYRAAPIVFVTNSDVVPAARRLGLTDEQMTFLPHAVDSEKLVRFARRNNELAPQGATTFFSPTRHDWVDQDLSWSKGNDRFLRALRIATERGARCRAVLVAWGKDLDASIELVSELGLTNIVEWAAPMKKRQLWARYLRSHAVVDQFLTPAIGGVTFEAMALGRRVVTALDLDVAEEFFGARPPVLAAATEDEIAEALMAVAADPDDAAGLGAAAQSWFRSYHSAERIVELEVAAYARVLERG